jgi:fructokinase
MNRIALIGEILVDFVVSKDFSITPVPGGSIFNTAASLAKLGSKVSFFSQVGNDFWGKYLISEMENMGIGHSGVIKSGEFKTPLAFAFVDQTGNASYDFYKSEFTDKIRLPDFKNIDCFHFGSFYSIKPENEEAIDNFISEAKKNDVLISYDPNYRKDFDELKNNLIKNFEAADIIKASIDDVEKIFGATTIDSAFSILEEFDPVLTILTLGRNGSAAKIKGRDFIKVESPEIKVVDTIGAGDNFSAGFLYYLNMNNLFTKDNILKIEDDFLSKMLYFADEVAGASLKVKGAGIDKEKLLELKESFFKRGR